MRRNLTLKKTQYSSFRCRCARGEPSRDADVGGACTVIGVIGSVSAAMIAGYVGAYCASKAAVAACGRHTRPSMAPVGSLEMRPPPGRSVRKGKLGFENGKICARPAYVRAASPSR